MQKLFISILTLFLCGCGTWHYEGAVQSSNEESLLTTEEPQPASGWMWMRERPAKPDAEN